MPIPKPGASAAQKAANQARLILQGVTNPVTGLMNPGAANYGNTSPAPVGAGNGPAVQAGAPVGLGVPSAPIQGESMGGSILNPQLFEDEYCGVCSDQPDDKIPQNYSPYAVNWNNVDGAREVRRGMLMLSDHKRTVNSAAYAAYYGLGILAVPPVDSSEGSAAGGTCIMQFGSSAGVYNVSATARRWLVRTEPKWSDKQDLSDVDSLTLTAVDNGSQTIRITCVEAGGVNRNAAVALTIRYCLAVNGVPKMPDGEDESSSTAVTGYDGVAWTGAATGNIDVVVTAGTWYVAAFVASREGWGRTKFVKVVIA